MTTQTIQPDDPCPVCQKPERDHSEAAAESCDRTFSRWNIEKKRIAWQGQGWAR